jgi:hypothetical protein
MARDSDDHAALRWWITAIERKLATGKVDKAFRDQVAQSAPAEAQAFLMLATSRGMSAAHAARTPDVEATGRSEGSNLSREGSSASPALRAMLADLERRV